ncbi:MAG: ATP-binding protein [Acidobacteria bacterium]|jgi:AAA15 family ATPase/GTPase|nr:ATP-binding protein [Acidobacteriota bacterium]
MKIQKLWIKEFKNLRDFEVDFDKEELVSVLVGLNGTGKSNLLEALVLIFRNLDLGEAPPFPFRLEYRCRERQIQIDAGFENLNESQIKIKINGEPISYNRFRKASNREYLPNFIFGYYSGPSNRMEGHFEKHQEKFYKDLLDGNESPLRPLFYARPDHSRFVLLAFFVTPGDEMQAFLKEYLYIEDLESILFIMKEPPWKSPEGDKRFWNARGTVKDLLDKLYKISLAPIRLSRRVPVAFKKFEKKEFLYLYVKDIIRLRELARDYKTQSDFFKALESTYISQLIDDVRIRVKVRNVDGSLTFRELSEGEQQLLMVIGLLRFTREDESLFLLDEPDTHLNPSWSVEYLGLLKKYAGNNATSHVIMTTHDPLVMAGLSKEQIKIMQREEKTGKIFALMPEENPRGMGFAGILTSDMFGLRSTLDRPTLELLDKKRKLMIKEILTEEEREELSDLNLELDKLGFSKTMRDPLYEEFVNAMTKQNQLGYAPSKASQITISPEERQRRKEIAQDIIKKLLQSEKEIECDT